MRCPVCGHASEMPFAGGICPKCTLKSDELANPSYVSTCVCGTQNKPQARFCRSCGEPIRATGAHPPTGNPALSRPLIPLETDAPAVQLESSSSLLPDLSAKDSGLDPGLKPISGPSRKEYAHAPSTSQKPGDSAVVHVTDPALHVFLVSQVFLGIIFGCSSLFEFYRRQGISISYRGSELVLLLRVLAYVLPWLQSALSVLVWRGKLAAKPWLRMPPLAWFAALFLGFLGGINNQYIQIDVQSFLPFQTNATLALAGIGGAFALFAPLRHDLSVGTEGTRKSTAFQVSVIFAGLSLAMALRLILPTPDSLRNAVDKLHKANEFLIHQ